MRPSLWYVKTINRAGKGGNRRRREGQTEEQRKAERQTQKPKTENNRRQREEDIAQAHAVLDKAKRGRTTL